MLFESAGRNIQDGLRLVNRAMADHHGDEPPNKRAKMIMDSAGEYNNVLVHLFRES